MKELSERKKLEILRLFLEGYPYEEISTKSGVAKGTVVNVVNDFRAGRFPAFGDLGDLVDTLRELSVELRRKGAGVSGALLGLALFSRLDKMGVTPEKLWLWADMCQEMSPADAPIQEFMAAALELFILKQETGQSYDSLVARCSELRVEAEKLGPEVEDLTSKKEELERTNTALAEERQGLVEEKQGLEKDIGELSRKREGLRQEVAELEGKRSALVEEVGQLNDKATALRPEVEALDGLGFGKDELQTLRARLEEVAARQGLVAEELRTGFFRDLAEYATIISFREMREKLEGEIGALEAQKESLQRLTSRLGAPPEEVEEAVRALLSLKRRGIRPSAVLSCYRVLSRADVEPEELEREILQLGGLRKNIASRVEKVESLEKEEHERSRVVEALRAEEATIKATIRGLSESGQRAIEEARENALRQVQEASQKMAEEIAEWGGAKAELGAYLEDLQRARYFTRLPLSSEALESYIQDMSPLVISQGLQVVLLWCSKKLNPKLRPPRWVWQKYYSIGEYTEVELADLVRWALGAFTQEMAGDE